MFRVLHKRLSLKMPGKPQSLSTTRTMSTTNYDYDGKTKVSILNHDFELGLLINSYSEVN